MAVAKTRTLAIAVVSMIAACRADGAQPPEPTEVARFPITPNHDLDILFVIDDSPTTAEMQAQLVQALPQLFAVLGTLDTPANLHIGVATTDMGTSGSLDPANPAPAIGSGPGSCAGYGKDGVLYQGSSPVQFLVDDANPDGSRDRNFAGSISDALAPLVEVGSSGCGFEQPMSAIRRALTNPLNAGFVRPAASLGVVLLSDEDDCSARDAVGLLSTDTTVAGPLQSFRCTRFGVVCDQPLDTAGAKTNCHADNSSAYLEGIDTFAAFFLAFKSDPRMLAVAEITGDLEPFAIEMRPAAGSTDPIPALAHSCDLVAADTSLEAADPAIRTADLLALLPESPTSHSSLCTADDSAAATTIGHTLKKVIGDPCVSLGDSCKVFEDEAEIPPCSTSSTGDCYASRVDATACPDTPGNTRLDIVGSPPPSAFIHVRC